MAACRLFCDEWEQASHGGELTPAVDAGLVERDGVTELGAVLTGLEPARESADETTLFDSTGLAIQDLALCRRARGSAPGRRDREQHPALWRAYSGIFPCLRFGVATRLVWRVSRARIRRGRVSWGTITSSM